jgi:hypothetical protein
LCNSHPVLWMLLDSGNSRRFLQLTSLRPSMGVKKDRGVRPSYTRPVVVSAFSISSRARDFCQQARVHWHSPHFFACPSGTGRSIVCIFFLTRKKKKKARGRSNRFLSAFSRVAIRDPKRSLKKNRRHGDNHADEVRDRLRRFFFFFCGVICDCPVACL